MSHKGVILAVDDDPHALALLVGVLGEEGYQVQPADSGRLALISVASQPPELILLDVRMPRMDGFEICRRIKETPEGLRIPIIFLSATRNIDQWVEGLALGAVDFISKPFWRAELLARVRTHIELGRLQSGLEMRVAQRTAELRNAIAQLQIEVAERRRAEQALRESELRFRQIANAAPVIIWTSDESNQIDFRNGCAQRLTGLAADQLTGDAWCGIVHPEDLERQRRAYQSRMADRARFQLEYRIRAADHEYRHMMDIGTPRFLPDGRFAGYVGILVDVTEVRESRERAFAGQNLENLRALSAGIAHDFNTLVGAIFGESDLALSEMAPDAPGRDSIERIVAIAKRTADIVRLLMAYAGDRSDDSPPELTDVSALITELVPHLMSSVLRHAVVRTNLDSSLPTVWARSRQIRQVVLNVIINAVEALEGKPGTVTVSTTTTNLAGGRYVKLEVADTGNGMPEEVRARIFDPYYSTKFLGRGLGLAAVQGIIRSHGGLIQAQSTPGEGTTFEILLPTAADFGSGPNWSTAWSGMA